MAGMRSRLLFAAQSVVAGLALAFVIVSLRPELIGYGGRPGGAGYAEAVAASAPAVANVFTERGESGRGALGSAVVIDPTGYVVTNYHVVHEAEDIKIQLADGRVATPEVVGTDPDTELALLRIDLSDLPSITLGRSDQLEVGEVVLAIGNSYGLSQTVTMGIVSATGRGQLDFTTYEDFIQTDAAINVGNSGGALINAAGELVGINTAVVATSRRTRTTPEGIGFAIPVNMVRGVVDELIENGRVIRGFLGIGNIEELSAEDTALLGLADGAIIVGSAQGPAADAGLRPGDVLTHFAGRRLVTRRQVFNLIAATAPGTEVEIRYFRDGEERATEAVLIERDPFFGS